MAERGFTSNDKLPDYKSMVRDFLDETLTTYQSDSFLGHLTSKLKRIIF
jgi:hypothetical protein